MKRTILILSILLSVHFCYAQNANQKWFNYGIGLRAEICQTNHSGIGLDVEHYFHPNFSINLTALTDVLIYTDASTYAKYTNIFYDLHPHLRWFAGAGFRYRRTLKIDDNGIRQKHDARICMGPSLMIGMGYTFKKAPINICIDWRPAINLIWINRQKGHYDDDWLQMAQVGVTLRFVTKRMM